MKLAANGADSASGLNEILSRRTWERITVGQLTVEGLISRGEKKGYPDVIQGHALHRQCHRRTCDVFRFAPDRCGDKRQRCKAASASRTCRVLSGAYRPSGADICRRSITSCARVRFSDPRSAERNPLARLHLRAGQRNTRRIVRLAVKRLHQRVPRRPIGLSRRQKPDNPPQTADPRPRTKVDVDASETTTACAGRTRSPVAFHIVENSLWLTHHTRRASSCKIALYCRRHLTVKRGR